MGSLLNFVFLSDKLEKNGSSEYAIAGPLFWYMQEKPFSYTLNGEIKQGYKNLLLIEASHGLSSFEKLPDEIINFILNNDVRLFAVSIADPSSKYGYDSCISFLNEKIPNKFYTMDSNSALNTSFTLDYFLEEATYKDTERNGIFNVHTSLGYVSEKIYEDEINNFREKKFLSFNRTNDKHHRAGLLHEYLTNDYSDSYFSFLGKIEQLGDIPYVGDIRDNRDFYNSKLPIELDTQNLVDKTSFSTSSALKKELFLNSCIHIVSETSFVNNELFVSEKVLKPILMYQPFIVIGPMGYLKYINEKYGFKTFSTFWDESYDEIEDYKDRLKSVLELIRELNKKSIEEFNEIYQKTKNICIYNRNLFSSLELDSIPQIFKKIEDEW